MSDDLIPIILRSGTAAAAAASNRVLLAAEPGFETDTRRLKVGDGATAWSDLPYTMLAGPRLAAQRVANGTAWFGCGRSFSTVPIPAAQIDTTGTFAGGLWTVLETGLYLVIGTIRLVDGTASGIDYAVGIDTVGDGSGTLWSKTVGASRHGASYSRIVQLTAGSSLRLYTYIDADAGAYVDGAELSAIRIA